MYFIFPLAHSLTLLKALAESTIFGSSPGASGSISQALNLGFYLNGTAILFIHKVMCQ